MDLLRDGVHENLRETGEDDCRAIDLGRMRVAFLTDIPTPYVNALLRELATRVDLTCLFGSRAATRGMNWAFDRDLGFRHRFVGGLIRRRPRQIGPDHYPDPRLLRHLRQIKPQAIISGGFSFPSLYALIYARLFGAALVIFSDGIRQTERSYGRLPRLARRILVPQADALIAKSELAAARFGELGGAAKTFVAHHTTNLAPFLDVGAARVPRADGPLRLIAVGRLIPRKGIDCLLRALGKIRHAPRAIHLTLVGPGPEEENLRRLAHDLGLTNVTFAGFADQGDLPALYRDADVLVMPTRGDTFGIVVLEAAASGLALLSSVHAGATHELVEDGVTGYRFAPENEDDLGEKIRTLAASPELCARMGRAANALAHSRTPQDSVANYLTALRFALRSGRVPRQGYLSDSRRAPLA